MGNEWKLINESANYLHPFLPEPPMVGIVTGSGLGGLAKLLDDPVRIPFSVIPHFAPLTTEGHSGTMIWGHLKGKPVLLMQGRYHYYEGFSLSQVVFPIRVMKQLGIKGLILTNACGAIRETFSPGDLMVITDHLNLVGTDPLIGENIPECGPRFPDAGSIYPEALRKVAFSAAEQLGISLRQGIFAWWSGPSYETPAEIRMLRTLGADAVGMSTVPEALAASHMGLPVLAIACLTNMATGIRSQKLTHEEVLRIAAEAEKTYLRLIPEIVSKVLFGKETE